MNNNITIHYTMANIIVLRRMLKNEQAKLRQLKFNRKMRDKRRK